MFLRSIRPPSWWMGQDALSFLAREPAIIEVEIALGAHRRERHLVPQIPLQPSDNNIPILIPKKSIAPTSMFCYDGKQGSRQTLHSIGIDLQQPVFSHGMLYVALSRSGQRENIAYVSPPLTRNVVHKEVLYRSKVRECFDILLQLSFTRLLLYYRVFILPTDFRS